MKPDKPWVVRLGRGIFKDVIVHRAASELEANEYASRYKQVHQRDPVLKLLGLTVFEQKADPNFKKK